MLVIFYRKTLSFFVLFTFFSCLAHSATQGHFKLEEQPDLGMMNNFKASELCTVAENSKHFIQQHPDDKFAVHQGSVFDEKITLTKVTETLDFLCNVYREDVRDKRQSRLHDVEFLTKNFDFYRWSPDIKIAQAIANKSTNAIKARMLNTIPSDKIFLTKYYTKLLTASSIKTEKFNQALYELPFDEIGLPLVEANKLKPQLIRFQFTRQQVIAGALLAGNHKRKALAKPLVWITEEALHDVLLQGTGVLEVDGEILR